MFGVEGSGFGVWGLGFGVWGLGFRVLNVRFEDQGLKCRIKAVGFGV